MYRPQHRIGANTGALSQPWHGLSGLRNRQHRANRALRHDIRSVPRRTRPMNFDILLQQHIGIPVEIINPFKKIEFGGKGLDMESLREIGPAMAVGVGLASRKVGDR